MSIAAPELRPVFKEQFINEKWEKYQSQKFFDELISSSVNPILKARAVVNLF